MVNIERSMRASDRFDGHFVQGHVNGPGIIYGENCFSHRNKTYYQNL